MRAFGRLSIGPAFVTGTIGEVAVYTDDRDEVVVEWLDCERRAQRRPWRGEAIAWEEISQVALWPDGLPVR